MVEPSEAAQPSLGREHGALDAPVTGGCLGGDGDGEGE